MNPWVAGPVIRPASLQDADGVEALARDVAAQPLLGSYGVTPDRLAADLREAVASSSGATESAVRVLLAEAAGRLQGFARVQVRGTLGPGAYLQLIALRPGHEGRGTGSALLLAVEELAAERSAALFLLTSDFNLGAQRFYERHGYMQVGRLPDYVRPGITELLYWKLLRASPRLS